MIKFLSIVLFEELFHTQESLTKTYHPKILMAHARDFAWEELQDLLTKLKANIHENDAASMLEILKILVPEAKLSTLPSKQPSLHVTADSPSA